MTKHDLALEMIFNARKNEVRFNWIGIDGFYGDNPAFLRSLANNGEVFIGDIHKDHRIYYEDPDQPYLYLITECGFNSPWIIAHYLGFISIYSTEKPNIIY